jgi:hypothetical protein
MAAVLTSALNRGCHRSAALRGSGTSTGHGARCAERCRLQNRLAADAERFLAWWRPAEFDGPAYREELGGSYVPSDVLQQMPR